MSAARDRLLDRARAQLGIVEGPGSNQVIFNTRYYGRPSAFGPTYAWCQVMVWCLGVDTGLASILPAKTAWTPAAAGWYQARGRWGRTPRVGAQVFYDWTGKIIAHTGIVESVRADGSFVAIEGNTDRAGGGSGGRVMRQHRQIRKLGRLGGFGYPDYDAAGSHGAFAPLPSSSATSSFQLAGGMGRRPDVLPVLRRDIAPGGWTSLAQQCLGITPDDDFGPATVAAALAQQRAYGLEADAEIGPWTWISFVADAGANLTIGDATGHPGIEVLQNLLGYRGADLDRDYGRASAERVREVQRWAGITVDAEVGPGTRAALTRG